MAVRIRLRRMGRKKKPQYRVVVTDKASARDGRFVETLGHYKPLTEPARLVIDLERVDYWIEQGALPSETVSSLIRKARSGGNDKLAVGEVDVEAEKARKAEALAAKRKAETAAESRKKDGAAVEKASKAPGEKAPQDVPADAADAPDEAAEDLAEKAEAAAAKSEAEATGVAAAAAEAEEEPAAEAETSEDEEAEEKKD